MTPAPTALQHVFDPPLIEGTFRRRYKRFFTDVELPSGEVIVAHCPNTGSLHGCLEAGNAALLRDTNDPKRKLRYSFQAIRVGTTWVNVDTQLPNQLVHEAIVAGRIRALAGYANARREVKYGTGSRIDVLLEDPERPPCYVEVKNTTLADGRIALFPDALTSRGRKHLGELVRVVERGERAVQFFLVSRDDTRRFGVADGIDPEYATALREAVAAGVEVLAYSARVTPEGIGLGRKLPVELDRVSSLTR